MITTLHQHQNAFNFLLSILHWHLVNLHVFNQFVFSYLASTMKKIFYHVKKSWIRRLGNIFQSVWDLMIRVWPRISVMDSCGTYFQECVHIKLWTVLQRHYTFRYRFKMKHFVRLHQAVLDTYQNTQCLPQVIIHKYPLYIYFWNYIKVLQPSPSPSTNKPTLSIFPHTTHTYHLHFRIPAAITSRDCFLYQYECADTVQSVHHRYPRNSATNIRNFPFLLRYHIHTLKLTTISGTTCCHLQNCFLFIRFPV